MPKNARKCKVCKTVFVKQKPLQSVCSMTCAIEQANKQREKAEKAKALRDKREHKAKLDAIRPLQYYIDKAQVAFNAYIRARDKNELCICCDKPLGQFETGGNYDCGHYRSRGSSPHLRFNEDNAFAQRKYCNTYLSGNQQGMRQGMIKRIGIDRVLAIENNNTVKKWTREELLEIEKTYKAKLKALIGKK